MQRFFVVVLAVVVAFACANSVKPFHLKRAQTRNDLPANKVTFTPHKLPCDFVLTEDKYMNGTPVAHIELGVRGLYLKIVSDLAALNLSSATLGRPDMEHVEDKVKYVTTFEYGEDDGFVCMERSVSLDSYKNELDQKFSMFHSKAEFDKTYNGEFMEVKCKVYERKINGGTECYYVSDDNYIIGASSDNIVFTSVRYSYKLNAPLDTFILEESKFPQCNNSAREKPKEFADQCSAHGVEVISIFTIASAIVVTLLAFF